MWWNKPLNRQHLQKVQNLIKVLCVKLLYLNKFNILEWREIKLFRWRLALERWELL